MTVSATTVTQYYTGIFRQAPSDAVNTAYQAMANDSAALNSMLSAANLQVDPVVRLYQTAFNRLPDTAGMTAWVVPYSTNAITLQAIANGFTQSTEFTTLYPTSLSNAQFVGALYWNILQRTGEDAGIKGWTNALDSGALTRAQVLLGFSESAEFTAKIEPNVNTFLSNIASTPLANQGQASLYTGNLFDVNGGSPSETFTLTTGIDTIVANGTASINGIINFGGGTTATAASTMNSFDKITGKAGIEDSLNISLTNASGANIGGVAAVAQVNTYTPPAPVPNVAQVTQYVFATAPADTATASLTYGGQAGSFTNADAGDGGVAATAASAAAAINGVAGRATAVVGGTVAVDGAVAAATNTFLVDGASAGFAIVAGMSVTGTDIAAGTVVRSVVAGPNAGEFLVTLNQNTAAGLADNATITFGGGVGGVVVYGPDTGAVAPSIAFSGTGVTTVATTLVTSPVNGTVGDTVTFTYGGVTGSYVVAATAADTATALANAINAVTGGATGTATAAVAGGTTVTLTANTPGTPLAALSFSGAAGTNPNGVVTTANVTSSGAISFGTVDNVEILNLRNASGSAATVAAATMDGVVELNSDRSTNDISFTGLTSSMRVGIKGDGTTTQLGALSGAYGATVTSGTVNISGGANAGALTVTGAALTTLNINSSGGAQASTAGQVNTFASTTAPATAQTINITAATSLTTGAIAGAALTTINASGAATTVNVGALVNNVTTVNGSGLTAGGITATLGTGILAFTGGAGTDTITTAATTAAGAVINAGAGTGDILVLAPGNDVTTSAKAAQYQNFEVLRNGTAGSVNASLFAGITSVQTSATGAGFTNLTAGQSANITVRANNNAATFALANSTGTTDVIGFTLNSSTNNITASSLTAVNVAGFETMNVVSSSGTNGAVNALSFGVGGAANLTALNISGAAPISLTTTNIALAAAINASAMTFVPSAGNYTFTVTGNLVKGSVVTGTGAADSITTTAAVTGTSGEYVTYAAGAGNDALSSTVAAINNTSAANASVKIDGGTGTDTLALTDAGGITMVDNNFQYLTNIETITYGVANQAISITSGGFFNTNFASGVTLTLGDATNAEANTVNLSTFTGNATVSLNVTAATTNASAITTGNGTDAVTLLAAGTTTATHSISTGAGNDTVNVTIGDVIVAGSVTINTGLGQDTITVTGNNLVNANTAPNIIVVVNEGGSTTAAADVVNGWVLNSATQAAAQLNFDGTAAVMANVGATASVIANVTYAVTNGIMSFDGSAAAGLTLAQKVQIAQAADIVSDRTVAFIDGTSTFVFHNGAAAADAGDSLVQLVGVTAAGLGTAVNSGANYVMIG